MPFYQATFEQNILFGLSQLYKVSILLRNIKLKNVLLTKLFFLQILTYKSITEYCCCLSLRLRIRLNGYNFNTVLLFLTLP